MILACKNISKSFGANQILKNVSFHVEDRQKVAIVGVNGAGKSTLLKIIMNELSKDEGEVIISKGKTIGYLSQHQGLHDNNTVYDEMLSVKKDVIDIDNNIRTIEKDMKTATGNELEAMLNTYTRLTHEFELLNGYSYKSETIGVLKGLGFNEDDFNKNVSTLSGGQKTRISLGKLLLSKPDIILLDEPTNHLDMESISWLENFLLNYGGCVIIVAHDRYFLDKVVTKIIELEYMLCTSYDGNYSSYAIKKSMLRDAQLKQYLNQQREIKHHEDVITKLRAFNREKSIKRAESREKLLDKIDRLDKPIIHESHISITLEPSVISGNDVLAINNLSKAYGNNILFNNLEFEIKRGEKIALIGNNGTGKTTILKIINDIIKADSGEIKLGSKVKVGYYDQEHNVLNMDKTLFDEISDAYPNLTETKIRNALAAFLFTGDDVFKKINDLSGGERGRVSLAKLMLSDCNFLILDEPTNHLDITSKEILERAINNYTGTVFYVSHDRYFINKTADRILELVNQALVNYIGNYDYYLEKKLELSNIYALANDNTNDSSNITESKDDWKRKKEEQAKERKRINDLSKTEDLIHQLEARNNEIDTLLAEEEVYTNAERLVELTREKKNLEGELSLLYDEWEGLME